MTTFSVKFLGCKVSQADVMLARKRMLEAGHTEVPEEDAEIHVINTCCITGEAEAKSRQATRRSLKEAEGRRVFVSGCAANLNRAQFDEIASAVTAVTGSSDEVAMEIPELSGPARGAPGDRAGLSSPLNKLRTRGFVKVQDGCDSHCSYCVVPRVRGSARSMDAGAVIDEVEKRVEEGQPEMVLTGISIGDYIDNARGWNLGRLMLEVANVEGVERVRLSSIEVMHITDEIVEALREVPKVCPHLHIPLQSGDDGVLRSMGRGYSSDRYRRSVHDLRERVPGLNITTDVIVGFPGEDDAAFNRTCRSVQDAGITKIHTFSFSSRPGTKAEKLKGSVAPQVKKERSKAMRDLSETLGRRYRSKALGSERAVLIDKSSSFRASGYTEDYVRVYTDRGTVCSGQLIKIQLDRLHADGVWGTVGASPHRDGL